MADEPTLDELGRRRAELRSELAAVTESLRLRVLAELEAGRSESEVARDGLVDRMTVRKWLGKR